MPINKSKTESVAPAAPEQPSAPAAQGTTLSEKPNKVAVEKKNTVAVNPAKEVKDSSKRKQYLNVANVAKLIKEGSNTQAVKLLKQFQCTSEDGCGLISHTNGLCYNHYHMLRQSGRSSRKTQRHEGEMCADCNKRLATIRELCTTCYNRKVYHENKANGIVRVRTKKSEAPKKKPPVKTVAPKKEEAPKNKKAPVKAKKEGIIIKGNSKQESLIAVTHNPVSKPSAFATAGREDIIKACVDNKIPFSVKDKTERIRARVIKALTK